MRGFPQEASIGVCRVAWVRVLLGPDGARCEAVGTRHRRPATFRLPLRSAVALMAAGVPGVVRRTGTAPRLHDVAVGR